MASLLLDNPATASARQTDGAHGEDHFQTERALAFLLIIATAVYLRVWDPWYSTAYMDESIFVVYGRMFLSRHFEFPLSTPLQWSFGWYLWPMMAAMADRIGGLAALREMAAALGTITVAATYGFASRVFSSRPVGLAAAAIMAVLGPAVLVSRIATRDSGSICFFALGLWAYACGWQQNRKRHWALAALCFFAAFLCKYLVAIYFPLLVLLALRKGRKPLLLFSLPLFAANCVYATLYYGDLLRLLRYGSAYNSLRAAGAQAWQIYLWTRWDFWIIAALAATVFFVRQWRMHALWLWIGALAILVFQWKSRADFDYWKHVNYALLFLAPLAAAGLIAAAQRIQKDHYLQLMWGLCGVLALAVGVAWLGKVQNIDHFLFWPNTEPALSYFEGRLTSNDHLLVDDTVFRYYFHPTLHQDQMTDPMSLQSGSEPDREAYKSAVAEGVFTYVILDGGIGEEARRMDADIRPLLGLYELRVSAVEPTLGQTIEIYTRKGEPAAESTPGIHIVIPATNSVVSTNSGAAAVEGIAIGAQPGWSARLEVFTDRWYPERDSVPIASDGSFHHTVHLGGEGRQQCAHLVRARLYDEAGHGRAVTLNYGITRANVDGSAPGCMPGR